MLATVVLLAAQTATAAPIRLTTADGAEIAGEAWGKGSRGVLLVHDEARSRSDWELLGPRLAGAGYRVLAIDLRGHGDSALSNPLPDDWSGMAADLSAAVAWLEKGGATEVHLVGERLGANLALAAASSSERVRDLVLVSPSLNHHGVRVSASAGSVGDRPVLVIAGSEDPMAVKTSTWLTGALSGPSRVELLPGPAGSRILHDAPGAVNLVVAWLDGGAAETPSAAAGPARPVRAGDVGKIETTGTRLEDRQR